MIDEILTLLIKKGKGIELNTGGFKYGLGHPDPTEKIIARYRELGGEIITIGADAHAPAHVAYAFEEVPAILKEAGFRYLLYFKSESEESEIMKHLRKGIFFIPFRSSNRYKAYIYQYQPTPAYRQAG